MSKLNKRIGKLTGLAIGTLMVFVLLLAFSLKNGSTALAAEIKSSKIEMHSRVDYNEEFEDDNVIVVLEPQISKINKIHNAKFFTGIEVESITDLTKREKNTNAFNDDFKQILQIHLKEKSKDNVIKAIAFLEKLEGVQSVEPNYIFDVAIDSNDPYYVIGNMWGLNGANGINVSNAWNLTRGNNMVRVGIIDTGIANHADLNANLVSGRDTFNNNDITNDDTSSHGTHVAGIVGAVGNNTLGVVGVNWNVSLVPLQAANDSNEFSVANVVAAIGWAQDRWGTNEQISIINYSVSGFGITTAVRDAINEYNGLFVWAAGNENENIDDRISTNGSFNLDNLISVGALNDDGTRRSTSNYSTNNTNVHIYAPGTGIYSTVPTWYVSSGYASKSGTSMAAPHVAGVAALMLSGNPNMLGGTEISLGARLKHALVNNADTISITIPNGSGGFVSQNVKKLNAFKATSSAVFTTGTSVGGISIIGSRADYTMSNNTNLILPERFAPLGTTTQQTVVALGNGAFANRTQLTQITIPTSVTQIGWEAFSSSTVLAGFDGNRSVIDLVVPEGMTSIYIANGWTGFNYVEMSATGPLKVISGQLHDKVEIPTFFNNRLILTIDEMAFAGQTYITEMILPSTITKIESSAFYNCTNLLKMNLTSSNNLTDVPDHSTSYTNYWYTERCMNVNMEPDTVYTLSFDYSGLTASCDIGNVFTSLGVGDNTFAVDLPVTKAFSASSGKQQITFIPTASQLSSSNKLWCRFIRTSNQQTVSINIKKVIVEKGITDIAMDAFTECTHLYSPGLSFTLCDDGDSYWYSVSQGNMTSQVLFIPRFLPNSGTTVSQIAASGFANNENIRWVFMQSEMETIGNRAFQFCNNLESVNMSVTAVTRIEDYTFDTCPLGTSLSLPSTLTYIGEGAFIRATGLTSIVLPASVTTINSYAFYSCTNLATVDLSATGVNTISPHCFESCLLDDFYYPPNVMSIGNSAFRYAGGPTNRNIPSGVTIIGDYAFANASDILNYGFPSSLKTIGNYAISNNGSSLIKLDNTSIETIGEGAFANTELVLTSRLPSTLKLIGMNAFYQSGFKNNNLIIDGAEPVENDPNENGLAITSYAFTSCNLEEIRITKNVTYIGILAFNGNSARVTYIEDDTPIDGWEAYWNIGDGSFPVFRKCVFSSDYSYIISFEKENGNPQNVTSSTATPTRKNYTFGGWYRESDPNTLYMDVTTAPNDTLCAKWTSSSCIAAGSLITLADGTQVAVENLTGNESLLVWNMLTGQYDTAPILFIDSDPYQAYEVITLTFSDNTQVKVIYEHAFFDMTIGEYVFLRNDAAQYIGHYFNKKNGNTWTTVQLTNVSVGTEYTTAWSPVTYGHLCYYVNGMLTMPGATEGFINIFDVDTTLMQYDAEQMASDIQTYGLYTYEEFNAIIPLPELVFNAFNGQYLKVSIGKGLITLEEIVVLLERYAIFFS